MTQKGTTMTTFTTLAHRAATAAVAATAAGALVLAGPAGTAAAPAKNTVTINAVGIEMYGKVKSKRAACKKQRMVRVYKQIGKRGGGDDAFFASDVTDNKGRWNTGNTGSEGKFYAKIRKTNKCKKATSKTIKIDKPNPV